MPCHPARARELLRNGEAAVFKRYPFTIILKNREIGDKQPITLKIDPGSKKTGMAIIGLQNRVLFGAELEHRGWAIRSNLQSRSIIRRHRRNRKTRYRKERRINRAKFTGWIPPSLRHRVTTTMTWVVRLKRLCGFTNMSVERVKFDMQLMRNSDISGVGYQQGALSGYSVREYLFQKWRHKCAYCGIDNVSLQIEHIQSKANGGGDSISNLALACKSCNAKKGSLPVELFLSGNTEALRRILAQAKKPLMDAAAVNTTRNVLLRSLLKIGLHVETGTGAQTKFNRTRQGYPKSHWIDAACVGISGTLVDIPEIIPLQIKATGHGSRQMCATDKFGFPRQHRTKVKTQLGFRTGDLAEANIPVGKFKGVHFGKVTVRSRPRFCLNRFDVNPKHLTMIQRSDGYQYA